MENLSALINSLSPGEGKLIRHFYKMRDFGEYRKRVQLFDLVVSGKVKDEEKAARLVGYKSPTASYHNLKSRLKSDILCILLMQEASAKFNTPYAQAAFSCRRALLTGELLLSRGVYHEGLNLLKKAARVAAKFELYAERIIAEDALRNHHAGTNSSHELNQVTEIIEDNYRLLGNMMKSKKKLYQTVFREPSTVNEPAFTYSPQQILSELDDLEQESESSRISFYSQLSRLNIFHNTGDVNGAINCAKGLLRSVEKDPVIMSKSNQAGIELEIANMYLRSNDYTNAGQHATKACQLFKNGMLNHLRAMTVLFYSQVHSGMYDIAQATLTALLTSKCLKDRAQLMLNNRLLLLKAWFHLVKGEIDSAACGLRLCIDLTKEKGAWFYGYSLLECLVMIEKRAFDAALYKLDSLRKVVSRAAKDSYVNRTAAAIAVFRNLIKFENDYTALLKSPIKELTQLQSAAVGYEWDPSGFELVRIDEFILTRTRSRR